MNNKKTSSWNLGVKGYIIVILAFFSCYVYSALTSDSLNVTRDYLSVLYQPGSGLRNVNDRSTVRYHW